MMINKHVKNTILCIATYGLNLLSSFIITTILIRVLGSEPYSFYPISNNISGWIVIISLSINAMAARFITVNIQSGNIKLANKYYSSVLFSNIFLCMILIIPIFILIYHIDNFINIPIELLEDVRYLFIFTCLSVLISMLTTAFSISEQAKDRLDIFYYTRILYTLIRFISLVVIFLFYRPCLAAAGIGLFLAELINFFIQVHIKSAIMPELTIRIQDYNFIIIKELTFSNIWCSISNLGTSLLFQLDAIISNIFLGLISSANISLAATAPGAITSLVSALLNNFIPETYHDYAIDDKELMLLNIKKAQKIVAFITSLVSCLFLCFAKPFFSLWVPNNDSVLLFQLSCFYVIPLIFSGMFRVVANVGLAMNKMIFFAYMTLINGIVNVLGMLILLNYSKLGIYSITIMSFIVNSIWFCYFIPKYISQLMDIKIVEFYIVPMKQIGVNIFWICCFVCFNKIFIINNWLFLSLAVILNGVYAFAIGYFILFRNNISRNGGNVWN